jgi:hypothetical protein
MSRLSLFFPVLFNSQVRPAETEEGSYRGDFPDESLGKRRWEEGQVAQLERKIGQQALEIDFLKGCLQRIDEQRKLQALAGKPLSTSRSKAKGRGAQP